MFYESAAYKDGRLRVDDRLIGIENVDLSTFERNADASNAIRRVLQELGSSAKAVRSVKTSLR